MRNSAPFPMTMVSSLCARTPMSGRARVFGHAMVYGDAWVADDAKIGGTDRLCRRPLWGPPPVRREEDDSV